MRYAFRVRPMNREAILLYLRVSAVFGLFFFAVYLGDGLSKPGWPWRDALRQAAVMGLFMGAGLGVIVTGVALKALAGGQWSQKDVTWFGLRQWTEVELPFGLLESMQLVEQELRNRREVTDVRMDADRQRVTARQALMARLVVSLEPVGPLEAATTRARIASRPLLLVNVIDVGTHKRDVEAIARALQQAVNRRLRAEQESAEQASLQAQLHQARLGLLQAQVEPHFLYNTLANLQLLIRDDPRAAEEMTANLIRYLRLSVPEFRGAGFTLGREIELVEAYLAIMKIRMGARLEVHVRVDEAAAALPFAPLLVHTLVENAIKHGLEPLPEGGRISIEARRLDDGGLRITVADTGAGLQAGREGSGMGLANLRERLALLYGDKARFTLEPDSPRGVVCVLSIPAPQARAT
ncbi:MAG: sensor histidine kinase [Usitatibacter sp.]